MTFDPFSPTPGSSQQAALNAAANSPNTGVAPTFAVNFPRAFVDIYPFEGGSFMLPYAAVLSCETTKVINGDVPGTFSVVIAPGGPYGVNIRPSWTEVITPMSTVVIGMARGTHAGIPLVGVVTQISEQNDWSSGEAVTGSVVISGLDFGYYFAQRSMYSLWFLGASGIQAANAQQAAATVSATSTDAVLSNALAIGTPDTMAKAWFTLPMAGTKGVFSKTYVMYRGQKVLFPDAMASWFEPMDALNLFAAYLMADDQTWAEKFKLLLPFPWYEFNVITAPPNTFSGASGGTQFRSQGLGSAITAAPTVVGRINPTPTLTASGSNTEPKFTGIDVTRWNKLPLFTMEGYAAVDTVVGFDNSAVLNYFSLNPTSMISAMGQSNSTPAPYIFAFAWAGNRASIERYGFRPATGDIAWLTDPTGQAAVQGNANDSTLLASLLARFCATYSPQGDMARASIRTFLRPDILPGCRFRFQPFKNGEDWDFYIDAVTHRHGFGQRSGTYLSLSRGLPAKVYNDTGASGLLFSVHTGNIQRLNGQYQVGLPAGSDTPLQTFPPGPQQDFFAGLAKVYQTPQALQTSP